MAEDVFGSFEDIVEKDDMLDVNTILSGVPPTIPKTDDDDSKKKDKKDEPILDVNKALEGIDELIKDKKDLKDSKEENDEDESVEDTEDSAPDHKETKKTDDTPSSSDAPFAIIFARDLSGRGLLSTFNEEEFTKLVEEKGEADALRHLIQEEVNVNIEAAKSDFEEGYQHYLELLGQGIPSEQVDGLTTLKSFFDGVTEEKLEENEDLRKEVLTRHLRATTSLSDTRIKKMVERSIDLGEDLEEAKDAVKDMSSRIKQEITSLKEEAERLQEEREAEQKRQLKILKENIDTMQEVIPGQRINKQTKDKIYADIIKPVTDKYGQQTNAIWAKRAEDPMFFDSRIAYLLETGFFEKGTPWNKIKSVKTTQESSELEEHLSKRRNTASSSGLNIRSKDLTSEEIDDIIKSTESIL